uniref:Peptide chain release factor domain-containing protein n=1 Tax=Romanomermis culicivorax TaxID=13658 RepID=A0A915JZG4_ROMCU
IILPEFKTKIHKSLVVIDKIIHLYTPSTKLLVLSCVKTSFSTGADDSRLCKLMKYLRSFYRTLLSAHRTERRFSCKPLLKEELTDEKFDSFCVRSRLDQLCLRRDNSSLTSSMLSILNLKRQRDECLSAINDLLNFDPSNQEMNDKEFYALAKLELDELREQKFALEYSILETYLLEEDQNDVDNRGGLILSAMTGAGGQESMLFAKELFTMYINYSRFRSWDCDVLEMGESDFGGYHFASAQITGIDAYKCLRFEAGIHRSLNLFEAFFV